MICPECNRIVSTTYGHEAGCSMPTRNDPAVQLPGNPPAGSGDVQPAPAAPRPISVQRRREALRQVLTDKYNGVVDITDECLDVTIAEMAKSDDPEIRETVRGMLDDWNAATPEQRQAALDQASAAAKAASAGLASQCVQCGYQFPRPQKRRTCQSGSACQRRQAKAAQLQLD